jgi:hypothetical protein
MSNTRIITAGIFLCIGIFTSACHLNERVHPSDTITLHERYFENYDGIDVSSAFIVDVQFSDTEERIEIEANQNIHPYIIVDKSHGVLRIRLKHSLISTKNLTLKAHIITKSISSFALSGATQLALQDSLRTDEVTVNLSGASSFFGTIEANTIRVFSNGASSATLHGSTNYFRASLSGASDISDTDMKAEDVSLNLSGASDILLTANGSIDIIASGASSFKYIGSGITDHVSLYGASQIIKLD